MKRFLQREPIIIFTMDRPDRPERNAALRDYAKKGMDMHGIGYKEAAGCYQGNEEHVFIVNATEEETVQYLTRMAQQDNYLYLDKYRAAYLTTPDDREQEYIGTFIAALRKPEGDYTNDNGQYYEVV